MVPSQIMTQHHSMLRRQALLLRAGVESLTEKDKARLQVGILVLLPFLDGICTSTSMSLTTAVVPSASSQGA